MTHHDISNPDERDPLVVEGFSPELSILIGEGHDGEGNIVPQITRIGWLQSLVDAFDEFPAVKKALLDATDDPDSMLEMIRECRDLARDGQAIINRHPSMKGPIDVWDWGPPNVTEASFQQIAGFIKSAAQTAGDQGAAQEEDTAHTALFVCQSGLARFDVLGKAQATIIQLQRGDMVLYDNATVTFVDEDSGRDGLLVLECGVPYPATRERAEDEVEEAIVWIQEHLTELAAHLSTAPMGEAKH